MSNLDAMIVLVARATAALAGSKRRFTRQFGIYRFYLAPLDWDVLVASGEEVREIASRPNMIALGAPSTMFEAMLIGIAARRSRAVSARSALYNGSLPVLLPR